MLTTLNIMDFLEHQSLSPSLILFAYQTGWFPMSDDEDKQIYWHSPERRAIFPLQIDTLKSSLIKAYHKSDWTYTINTHFQHVIEQCANRDTTWISDEIIQAYSDLHAQGFAHSVEVWDQHEIIGGLYGVTIGSAFFGESMFSMKSNASKMAFVHVFLHLIQKNFTLLDSQYINDHTKSLGAITISRIEYLERLSNAVQNKEVSFLDPKHH